MQAPVPETQKKADSRMKLIWKRVRRHPFLKLTAVLIAILFWMIVIASDPTLERQKEMTATISVTGADTLRSRGYVVTDDLTSSPITVNITAKVTQGNYDRATAASFSPRLDLSQITSDGQQDVSFSAGYSTYGEIQSFEPKSMTVNVERYITRSRVPVVVRVTGEMPQGLWRSATSCDPNLVSVSGPASLVEQVRRAVVELPLEGLSADMEDCQVTSPVTLETADGQTISSPLIRITFESVTVDSASIECSVLPTRSVAVDAASAITGTPAHGYEVGEIRVSPETVTVADSAEALKNLEAMFVQSPVDVTGATEDLLVTVPLAGATAHSYCSAREVAVSVTIRPATHTHTYNDLPVQVENLGPGLKAALSRAKLGAVLSGAYQDMESLKAANIHLYVDAQGLAAGVYNVEVQCRVDGAESYDFTPQQQTLTLTIQSEAE
ncbi:MAG: CdaR family protein [Clostridiales bacterium]|nr:CdaR family protein [Clostridiales bacterium]MDY2834133.1 CdaR family protein [Candidatus Aphodomonas sp.]